MKSFLVGASERRLLFLYGSSKTYSTNKRKVIYDYNVNTVYFDGIQLYKEEFGNSYTYDSYHNVKTATTAEGEVYSFNYDTYGNNTSVSISSGGSTITSTAAYSSDGNRLTTTTNALGDTTTYSYNANTNVLEWVKYPEDTDATKTSYSYDSMYRIASASTTTNTGTALTVGYTYSDDMLTAIQTGSTTYSFAYGDFALRSSTKIGSRTLASYSYSTDGNHYLTSLDYGNGDSVDYSYDKYGNVTKETYEDSETVSYVYDNNGDLATVTDSATGRKNTYYYDTSGTATDTINYTYGDSAWGDLLTAYDGTTYSYDTIGNLTSDGYYTYTWEHGRELAGMSAMMESWSFEYDANGMRTRRTGRVSMYDYVYNGSQLIKLMVDYESLGEIDTLYFTYDVNGTPLPVKYNGEEFYYVTNIQGDVISILNSSGEAVVSYTYDAWGNILTKTGSLANSLGRSNPLCYRGYVYDRETGLYYLESRYYDPEMGRFLNADSQLNTDSLFGYNSFAYCENNPINKIDPSGHFAIEATIGALLITALVVVAAILTTYVIVRTVEETAKIVKDIT